MICGSVIWAVEDIVRGSGTQLCDAGGRRACKLQSATLYCLPSSNHLCFGLAWGAVSNTEDLEHAMTVGARFFFGNAVRPIQQVYVYTWAVLFREREISHEHR